MPELEQKPQQKRQIAYRVRIFDILNGDFVTHDIFAGYVKFNDLYVSRVNVIATLVYKSENNNYANAIIDDGTGRILLRSFGNPVAFSKADVGDVVLVIGRVREFNNERYIMPEILKKLSIDWLNVRKLELKNFNIIREQIKNNELLQEEVASINDEVYSLIKKLDDGDGASVEDVLNKANSGETASIIHRLLENGDIFEIKPGKLKVLE